MYDQPPWPATFAAAPAGLLHQTLNPQPADEAAPALRSTAKRQRAVGRAARQLEAAGVA